MMQAYADYKDSGVDWLGEIPAEWDVKPGMVAFTENKRNNKGMKQDRVLSLSYGNIIIKPKEKLVGLVPESFETYQIIEAGDIIIRGTDLQNDKTSLRTGLAKDDGIITSAYLSLRVRPNFSSRFLHYYLHTLDTSKMIYKYGSGLRQNLSFEDFKRLPVFDLPLPEQTAIADFLDDKTAKIDELVGIKRRQIALLGERKQILIQNAVTKGLNPDAPMKDSGVDWIGKIPAHWRIAKLKLLTNKIVDGAHFTPTYVSDGIPFLRVTDLTKMKNGKIQWDSVRYIPVAEHIELIKRANPEKGDVLLSKNGTIGLTKVIDWDQEFSFFVSLCLIKLNKLIDSSYFTSFFNSPIVDKQISFGSSRTSVTNLHLEKIKELLVVLPPLEEQKTVVEAVGRISKPIEAAITIKQKQITKLNEYKTTLINAAVTGKIKVV